MPYFQKRPVEIEARQLVGSPTETHGVGNWLVRNGYDWLLGDATRPDTLVDRHGEKPDNGVYIDPADGALVIRTLEGDMKASYGDWIIKGVQGEFYPCKPDIFKQTYVQVEEDSATNPGGESE